MKALMAVIGALMLLPGLCSLIFIFDYFTNPSGGGYIEVGVMFWLASAVSVAFGILLIRKSRSRA